MSRNEDPVDRLIRSVLEVAPGPGFESRILKHVQREAVVRRGRFVPMAALSGAIAAVVMILVLNSPQPPVRRPGIVSVPVRAAAPAPASEGAVSVTPRTAAEKPVQLPSVVVVSRPEGSPTLAVPEHRLEPLNLAPLMNASPEISADSLPAMALSVQGIREFAIEPFSLTEGGTE